MREDVRGYLDRIVEFALDRSDDGETEDQIREYAGRVRAALSTQEQVEDVAVRELESIIAQMEAPGERRPDGFHGVFKGMVETWADRLRHEVLSRLATDPPRDEPDGEVDELDPGLVYIRHCYGVPAYRGYPVTWRGECGTVVGASGPHVLVRVASGRCIIHPKDPDLDWRLHSIGTPFTEDGEAGERIEGYVTAQKITPGRPPIHTYTFVTGEGWSGDERAALLLPTPPSPEGESER